VILDKSLIKMMGKAEQEKVKQNFTWERLAEKTEKTYRDLLTK
jgi:glycosyltransferase involved in cell wall biosynthesis